MTALAKDNQANAIQVLRPSATVVQASTATAANVSGLSSDVRVLRLVASHNCFYNLEGTATTNSVFLPAGAIEFVKVNKGDVLSVIRATEDGTVYVTEME